MVDADALQPGRCYELATCDRRCTVLYRGGALRVDTRLCLSTCFFDTEGYAPATTIGPG